MNHESEHTAGTARAAGRGVFRAFGSRGAKVTLSPKLLAKSLANAVVDPPSPRTPRRQTKTTPSILPCQLPHH